MSTNLDTRFIGGLEQNTRTTMISLLNDSVADTIDLTLAVKQAHWNLKGPGFIGVHELLDEVADRLRESSDLMAERVQVLGGQAKGTSQVVAEESDMEAYPTDLVDIEAHVEALTSRFADIGARIRKRMDEAGEAGDEDTADILTEVSRQLDKDGWFIGANKRA